MKKNIIFSLVLFQIFFLSMGQPIDTSYSMSLMLISQIERSDLIIVYPSSRKTLITNNESRYNSYLMSKSLFYKEVNNMKRNEIKYIILNPQCFGILTYSPAIYKYIIPIVSDSIAELLKHTYPYPILSKGINIAPINRIELDNYDIAEFPTNRYLLVLMSVELLNEIESVWSPETYLFKNNKYGNGLYIKILIPIHTKEWDNVQIQSRFVIDSLSKRKNKLPRRLMRD